jgi:hypothetical protein
MEKVIACRICNEDGILLLAQRCRKAGSVLLIAGQDGNLGIINRPSGGDPRPVPVLLGVRQRTE